MERLKPLPFKTTRLYGAGVATSGVLSRWTVAGQIAQDFIAAGYDFVALLEPAEQLNIGCAGDAVLTGTKLAMSFPLVSCSK